MPTKKQIEKTAETNKRNKAALEKIRSQELTSHITQFSREPFQELLVALLLAAPDPHSVHEAANKSPDRYLSALTQAAKLAGYNETTVNINAHVDLNQLSDSQLEAFIAAQSSKVLPSKGACDNEVADDELIDVTPDQVEQ